MKISIPELELLNHQLSAAERHQKPKMLVVDDEPDNLDLLYRTFRRDFQVFRAENGIDALGVLSNAGEVAVIISDQRMPEMKGTEFLSKTVPQYPNTMRIILTGFTDVEDLVDAINSGQVYKYITKPWDPTKLKALVQTAVGTYQMHRQQSDELRRASAQTNLVATIVQVAKEADSLESCLSPLAEAFCANFAADTCILQLVQNGGLQATQGSHAAEGDVINWLQDDPFVKDAMASLKVHGAVNVAADDSVKDLEFYKTAGIQAHIVIPITYRQEVLAVLSLQWQKPWQMHPEELTLLHLSAQQVALVLTCKQFHQA